LMHEGGHGTIPSDWPVFLKFMQMHFQGGEAGGREAYAAKLIRRPV